MNASGPSGHLVFIKTIDQPETCKLRKLGSCLLISSLPGKALRMLDVIAKLAERFNMHSQSRAW